MPKNLSKIIFLVFVSLLLAASFAHASNIDKTYHWAWNEKIGWIDFRYSDPMDYRYGNVNVMPTGIEGYANNSQVGIVSFNCNASGNPDGIDYCSTSNYKVSNDGSGNLSGWAWNSGIGWISFDCSDTDSCATSDYHVTYDSQDDFHGWAWNDSVGWISFNCAEPNACSASDYKVKLNDSYSNIDVTDHWAWNDDVGWIDFSFDEVNVTSTELKGYAYSRQAGVVSLNCDSTGNPSGTNYCSSSDYKVSNDGSGNLSGWAWNDDFGWISFDCSNTDSCATSNYQVTIDSDGYFHGWAWNDDIGWISFNCAEPNICSTSDYKVKEHFDRVYPSQGTLLSVIYDTEQQQGAALTGIVWQGTIPSGTAVQFELGSSNSTSSDSFQWTGPYNSSAWKTDWWQVSVPVADLQYHNNHRYIRYRVTLTPDSTYTKTPVIYDIIMKWAR